MRTLIPLTMIALLAGCTTAPPAPAAPDPKAQARLSQMLSDKVAGPPQSCLPNWRTQNMVVIDDSTIVFRETTGRVWVQKPQYPCDRLGGPSYALITRSTLNQLCQGDIAQVIDTTSNITAGSCVMGPFIPYARPGA